MRRVLGVAWRVLLAAAVLAATGLFVAYAAARIAG